MEALGKQKTEEGCAMVDYLLELNERHSEQFINSQRSRQIYRHNHPTEIAVMKCMDGRVHLPVITKTPLGIMQPWRNIGGKFNLGWPHYKDTIKEWTNYTAREGKESVIFVTYHFARGFEGESQEIVKHRGCAGHGYDTEEAIRQSLALKKQFDQVFKNDGLFAIHCGVETDLDALILHGENGERVDLAEVEFQDTKEILEMLKRLYPHMPLKVINDIVPLIQGNIEHIADVRKSNRKLADSEHRERVLAVGRLFDWLHEPNLALIMGPFDPELKTNIIKAAGILQSNIDEKRIDPKDGVVLLVSVPFSTEGSDQKLSIEKAKWLKEFAYSVIENDVPRSNQGTRLIDYLSVITATCDLKTRKLHLL